MTGITPAVIILQLSTNNAGIDNRHYHSRGSGLMDSNPALLFIQNMARIVMADNILQESADKDRISDSQYHPPGPGLPETCPPLVRYHIEQIAQFGATQNALCLDNQCFFQLGKKSTKCERNSNHKAHGISTRRDVYLHNQSLLLENAT